MRIRQNTCRHAVVIAATALYGLILTPAAEAHPAFSGRAPRMNIGMHYNAPHTMHNAQPPPMPYYPYYGWHGGFWAGVGTAVVIGSIVASLPPSCSAVSLNGVIYQHCGYDWYMPQYRGPNIVYVVVASPY